MKNKIIYAIGDVQGCYKELMILLDKIQFDPATHQLWFTGDLINRGPDSLSVLRLVKSLKESAITVLGNHDFYLLALHYGISISTHHTLDIILNSKDREELVVWLKSRPLFYYREDLNYALVHAGLAPQWDITEAQQLAREVEKTLISHPAALLSHIYGDKPNLWTNKLKKYARWRCIINYFTRMRCCTLTGKLNLKFKRTLSEIPPGYVPWFNVPFRKTQEIKIIFGHWAALNGKADHANIFALDTGCVWGKNLTAMSLKTQERISVQAIAN